MLIDSMATKNPINDRQIMPTSTCSFGDVCPPVTALQDIKAEMKLELPLSDFNA